MAIRLLSGQSIEKATNEREFSTYPMGMQASYCAGREEKDKKMQQNKLFIPTARQKRIDVTTQGNPRIYST